YMFQLSEEEAKSISRSQNATLKQGHNIKYLPYVFTEQGVAMLSGILTSDKAIEINIMIMDAFVEYSVISHNNPTQSL
ncbi:MAG: ORF6N domain-containing protein, partial [Candidatus Margulisiibacteriota bacterium]